MWKKHLLSNDIHQLFATERELISTTYGCDGITISQYTTYTIQIYIFSIAC